MLCVNPAITYGIFEKLKSLLLNGKGRVNISIGAIEAFVLGALSKSIATIVTCKFISNDVLIIHYFYFYFM